MNNKHATYKTFVPEESVEQMLDVIVEHNTTMEQLEVVNTKEFVKRMLVNPEAAMATAIAMISAYQLYCAKLRHELAESRTSFAE